jgi:hypothetical protein
MGLGAHRQATLPRQTLHIFITNLKCVLNKKNGKKPIQKLASFKQSTALQQIIKPDPFVAFLSEPKRLVKEERTTWQKFEGFFRGAGDLRTVNNGDGTSTRTAGGWPRTKKLNLTESPDWSSEEIHLKVKSHTKDGIPLNHTGAILFFSVFNAASLELSLIGTFPMNLANLCTTAKSTRWGRLRDRSSFSLEDLNSTQMTSFQIDESLCKNGRETGWIKCDIGACWLDDHANTSQSVKCMRQSLRGKNLMSERTV